MKATKISIALPSRDDLLEGLDERTLHPKLAKEEQRLNAAKGELDAARQELRRLEGEVSSLPGKIRAGTAAPDDLQRALRDRDAEALKLAPIDTAIGEAADRVAAERERARQKVEREVGRRRETLARAAEQLAPILEQLRDLEGSLAKVLDPQLWGLGITWPQSWAAELELANQRMLAYSANEAAVQPPINYHRR